MESLRIDGTDDGIWAEFNRVWRRKRKEALAARAAMALTEDKAAPLPPRRRRRLDLRELLTSLMTVTAVTVALASAAGTVMGALFRHKPRPSAEPISRPAMVPTAPEDTSRHRPARNAIGHAGRRRGPLVVPDISPPSTRPAPKLKSGASNRVRVFGPR